MEEIHPAPERDGAAPRVVGRRVDRETVLRPTTGEPHFLAHVLSGAWGATPQPPVAVHGARETPPAEKQTQPASDVNAAPAQKLDAESRVPMQKENTATGAGPPPSTQAPIDRSNPQPIGSSQGGAAPSRAARSTRSAASKSTAAALVGDALSELSTDKLLQLSMGVRAPHLPHVSGFYGKPRTDRLHAGDWRAPPPAPTTTAAAVLPTGAVAPHARPPAIVAVSHSEMEASDATVSSGELRVAGVGGWWWCPCAHQP